MLRGAPSSSTEVRDTKYAPGTTTNPRSHLVVYLGRETKVTSSQSCLGGTVNSRIKSVGRVANPEASKAPPLMEVWVQSKPPIHNLSTTFGPALEGNLLGYSLRDLMFNSCVRGASRPTYTKNWVLHSLSQTLMFF
jgi:hypothetical protein